MIQIFGRNKCFNTKKAQRFFKERNISFQYINLAEKNLSKGELEKIIISVGGIEKLANPSSKNYALFGVLTPEGKISKMLEDSSLVKSPLIRNGNKAAVLDDNIKIEDVLKVFLL